MTISLLLRIGVSTELHTIIIRQITSEIMLYSCNNQTVFVSGSYHISISIIWQKSILPLQTNSQHSLINGIHLSILLTPIHSHLPINFPPIYTGDRLQRLINPPTSMSLECGKGLEDPEEAHFITDSTRDRYQAQFAGAVKRSSTTC